MKVDVKYISKENPFNYINVFEDDSYVIVGSAEPSEQDLLDMIGWNDVDGYIQDFEV